MSFPRWVRPLGVAAALSVLAASSADARDSEVWSYAQPGNALVMPFDATDGQVSFLTASNIGPEAVTSHWVFWSEDCDHLVDVWMCLTPNDTTVVDPTDVQALGPDNERVGPVANLSGYRGSVIVTAYETNSSCSPAAEGGIPTDDALVGSYTIATLATSAAFGNDAIVLGLDPTGTYTDLPDEDLAPYMDFQTLDPSSVEDSLAIVIALREQSGSAASDAEVGPLSGVTADLTFYDNLEIPTSLPSITVGCTTFTPPFPDTTVIDSAGFLRLTNIRNGSEPVGGDTWLFGIHEQTIDRFGTSVSAKYVLEGALTPPSPEPTAGPTPTPAPTPDPEPTDDPEPTPDPEPTDDPDPTPEPTAAPTGCTSVTVTADVVYDDTLFPDVSGITTMIGYPEDQVSIPGSLNAQTVLDATTNLTNVAGGLFNVSDQDDPGQGDVAITVGLVAIPGPIPSGPFAAVAMDCTDGQPAPEASDFECTVDASTLLGAQVTATCDLTVDIVD